MNTTTKLSKKELFKLAEVTLIAEKNPKKPGSMAHERFQGYFTLTEKFPDGFTIGDCLDVGLRQDDFRHDEAHGFIKITRLDDASDEGAE